MKCQNCGANLEQGVSFCRECGSKVISKLFCRECGQELLPGAKFCVSCGADANAINKMAESMKKLETNVTRPEAQRTTYNSVNRTNTSARRTTSNIPLQRVSKKSSSNSMLIIVAVAVVIALLILVMIGVGIKKKNKEEAIDLTPTFTSTQTGDYTIELDRQYAYMSDEWNVYIAVPVSDTVIKVEHWDKTMNSSKKVKYSEDIGSFKINDSKNGFAWVDDDHAAFSLKLNDKNNSRVSGQSVIFTINISDTDVCKGTDYDEKIACYSYQNDDWHNYRAIPLSEYLVKIECWYRGSSAGKFLFGYDMCVLNVNSNDTDFEWNSEKTAFTITIRDPQNKSYWKGDTFVSFTLENLDYKYATVLEYLGLKSSGTSETGRTQKNEFENNSDIVVGAYSMKVPSYWSEDINDADHYRAYAETSGKVAMLEVISSFDESDPVTWDILEKETEEGLMSSSFQSWFESCGDVTVDTFDNGNVKGYTYSMSFTQDGLDGQSKCLCFPDEKNNCWIYVTLLQTNNTEFQYDDDFNKILNSVVAAIVEEPEKKEESVRKDEITKSEETVIETPKEEKKESSIPAFAGSSLDSVVKKAEEHGLSEVYDEDFGHGTRMKAMSDSSGGLMIDIIYVTATKEVMCGNITTNKLASSSDQKKFVKGMAAVLCPSADSSDVSSWVSNNVGSSKTTTIGGFTYELGKGLVDNILYYAGNAEWETWELSQ